MIDRFGRVIDYLRISVTDRCNLRCRYCMPAEGVPLLPAAEILRFEEIVEVARAAADLGMTRVRLTGGEPLVRRGIETLVGMLSAAVRLADLSMTTNGQLLTRHAAGLAAAGLRRVNVSIDTLDPGRYTAITRGGDVRAVLAGIEAAPRPGSVPSSSTAWWKPAARSVTPGRWRPLPAARDWRSVSSARWTCPAAAFPWSRAARAAIASAAIGCG